MPHIIEVTDLAALAGHGWAWKYQDHTGKPSLHLIRGTVRNVPGEDYYLTELKGAVRFSHVDFSYVPGKRILKENFRLHFTGQWKNYRNLRIIP